MTRPAELVHVGANPKLCFQQERSRCGKRKYLLLGELVQTPHSRETPSPHGTLSRCSPLGSSKALTVLSAVLCLLLSSAHRLEPHAGRGLCHPPRRLARRGAQLQAVSFGCSPAQIIRTSTSCRVATATPPEIFKEADASGQVRMFLEARETDRKLRDEPRALSGLEPHHGS